LHALYENYPQEVQYRTHGTGQKTPSNSKYQLMYLTRNFCFFNSTTTSERRIFNHQMELVSLSLADFMHFHSSLITPNSMYISVNGCHWLGLPGLGLACLDSSVDPKSQISSTCKSPKICITSKNNTNSTRIIETQQYIFLYLI
jgi:hypothetical protein